MANIAPAEFDYVDLTGVWLVHFGYFNAVEGSRILTLNGAFERECLLKTLQENLFGDLPVEAKRIMDNDPTKLTIRSMNRLG